MAVAFGTHSFQVKYSADGSSTDPELLCSCLQLWAKPGPLPQEVQSLAGGFTDAPNACGIEQEEPKGFASWWRYQGFKL